MFNQVSYNVVIERFKVFADGHFLIRRFSHGQVDVTDIDKDQLFPWMHVAPVDVKLDAGSRIYTFDVIFADMPRDKEDATDYQREVISDCVRLCEDLVNEIANGGVVFGEDVELETGSTITPFIAEYTHTLCGATLAISISVPNDYSACDIPANWSIGGGGSSTPPAPSAALILKVNTVDNVNQTVLDITQGANITITDLGDGRVKFDASGDLGTNWGTIGGLLSAQLDLQGALDLKADISSLGVVAFSNDYNDLDNLPTIPAAQVNSDWNATSGVEQILNKPTLATVATSGSYLDLSNQPSIPAAQVNSDWNATSGVAQILNKPSIGTGTVSSVGLSVPAPVNPALSVSGSPVTSSGTLAITAQGTSSQYIDGTGALQTMPTGLPPSGTAGGDLAGTYPNPTVDGIHGIDMQSGTPSTNDAWIYGGSPAKWQHQHINAGIVDNDSQVTGTTVKDALNHLSTTKVEANAGITAATKTKITYDTKGLVTAGADLAASDIPSGIDAAKIGSGTVSNTEFGYLDGVTSALQSQIDGKQATLVSGTTIKTINSSSLLGSGDVAVQATLVSGTNIKTINSISLLGSGNIPIATSDSTIFSSNPNATQGANSTGFWAITGSLASSGTEGFRTVVMPVAGTLKNLYIRNGTLQSSTGSMVFTVRKNGADTAMTVTFTNADGATTTKSDTTNTVSVVAGDLICIKGFNAAPSSASGNFVSFSILLER